MRLFALAALVAPIALTQAIEITGPSQSAFWVFNASNTITWTFSSGDPSPINIVVVNQNNQTLNGPFAIATDVNINETSVTITNITVRPGDGYQVQFVNTTNITQVFAVSNPFTMKPNGSEPAPPVSSSTSAPSGASTSGAGSTSAPSSSSTSPTGGANNTGGALSNAQGLLGILAACGLASLTALML